MCAIPDGLVGFPLCRPWLEDRRDRRDQRDCAAAAAVCAPGLHHHLRVRVAEIADLHCSDFGLENCQATDGCGMEGTDFWSADCPVFVADCSVFVEAVIQKATEH